MMSWDKGWRTMRRAALAVAGSLLVVSCGGGDQVERFVPTRVLAFGDEHSVMVASDGVARKYTINFRAEPTEAVPSPSIDCTQLPIWTQIVANSYGLPFSECPGTATATPSRILAKPNARVAGTDSVTAQIGSFLATDRFGDTDLVTVMAGMHDILALHAQIGSAPTDLPYTMDDALRDAGAAGAALAAQVNRIAEAGGKVLIATVPRVGYTPFGQADATQLNALTDRFNERLRVNLLNDGRRIGLVLADQNIRAVVEAANLNVTAPACTGDALTDVLQCDSQTLEADATPSTWLWADRLHLSPAGHSNIGSLAVARATGNPF